MNTFQTTLLAILCSSALLAQGETRDEPKELQDLRGSFEKARTAALSPLEKKYVDALTAMKDRLTKKGDLKGALAVDAEINRFKQPTAQIPSVEGITRLSKFKELNEFSGWLATTRWKATNGSVLRFADNNTLTVTKADGSASTYNVTVGAIGVVTWTYQSTGKQDTITIDPNLKTGVMKSVGHIEREGEK